MKKNQYGNIEDLLVHLTIVTPKGTIQVYIIILIHNSQKFSQLYYHIIFIKYRKTAKFHE